MMSGKTTLDDFDWSLTTFDGVRREQLRRWAALPLEDIIRGLEEMDELNRALHGHGENRSSRRDPDSG